MAKTKNITRKNRKQRGGIHIDPSNPEGTNTGLDTDWLQQSRQLREMPDMETTSSTKHYQDHTTKQEEKPENTSSQWFSFNPLKGWFKKEEEEEEEEEKPVYGGNKKQPNPAFGGYLKGGKKHVRNTKKNTKKRTGGNKCNCGCRNCRCSRKDCKCKCADKRFKCTCNSRTCGCKRTLKRRKH